MSDNCVWCGRTDDHESDCELVTAAMDLLNTRGVHINTRDENGVKQPLDAKTIVALAELVRAYDKTLVGPNGGPYVAAGRLQSGPNVIHYGPVWDKPRKNGETFAACESAAEYPHATLTTYLPWVTCDDCKARVASKPNKDSV